MGDIEYFNQFTVFLSRINMISNVWLAFITGLTTGGISCFAVQGGLLASSIAGQKEADQRKSLIGFLISRIIAYTLLGFLLGAIGSSLFISPKTQGVMQIIAGLFMILTAAKLLEIHPIFKRIDITAPKSFFKILRKKSLDKSVFSSSILGFLTVLIPCGVTQAMMLLSIASGSAIWGGLILGGFTLGTTPIFLGMGIAWEKIFKYQALKYIAATIIIFLGITSINTGQTLRGSVHTLKNYWLAATGKLESQRGSTKTARINSEGKQEVKVIVNSKGYSSDTKTLKAGVPVKLIVKSDNVIGCARSFTIPEYNISQVLPQEGETVIEFTPSKKGKLVYTCSMGMFSNFFEVE